MLIVLYLYSVKKLFLDYICSLMCRSNELGLKMLCWDLKKEVGSGLNEEIELDQD